MQGAQAVFTDFAPPAGLDDKANLTGAASANDNVNAGAGQSLYLADDQSIQGQTFTTGNNPLGYQFKSVTIRHVVYDTYALVPDLTYTIRVTRPSGSTLTVLASETANVPANTPGNIYTISGGNNAGPGSGYYVTFTFDTPVLLNANTVYGFDVGGGTTRHYWETDGTSTDAHAEGAAYSSGSGGIGNTTLESRTGDRVFIASLTPVGTAVPPYLTLQPSSVSLYAGKTAHFNAVASGSLPLTYQWRKNGVDLSDGGNISGAQTNRLTIGSITAGDATTYTLVVSNSANSVTSAPAGLTVVSTPLFGTYPHAVLTNNPVAHWRLGETGDPATGTLPAFDFVGGLNGTYGTGSVVTVAGPRGAAFPGLEATNAAVQTSTNNGTRTWVTLPALNLNTNTVTLTAWIRPNAPQGGDTGLLITRGGTAAGLNFSTDNQLGYLWNGGSAATYTWQSGLRPATGAWSFVALVIDASKATMYLGGGGDLTAAVNPIPHASESWASTVQLGGDQETIDWRIFDGLIDEVAVFNNALSFDQINALYGVALGAVKSRAPTILSKPQAHELYAGKTARYDAIAVGSSPLTYQWRHKNVDLAGATADALLIANVSATDAGSYTLVVANSAGATTSSPPSTLSVLPRTPFNYADTVLSYSPVAYWRLNEGGDPSPGGLTAFDCVNGVDAIYERGAQNGSGGKQGPRPPEFAGLEPSNTAAQTTGTGDWTTPTWVTLPGLNLHTNAVSFTLWIHPMGFPGSYTGLLMTRMGTDAGIGFTSGGQIGYTWNGGASATWEYLSGLIPPTELWSFVAVVIDPTKATFYLYNSTGQASATNEIPHMSEAWEGMGQLGGDQVYPDWRIFDGLIDEVAVFNYALSPAQVQSLYTRAITAPPPAVTLGIRKVGTELELSWAQGSLLEAPELGGPWTTNSAPSPYKFTPAPGKKLFRVQVQ